MDLDNMSEQDQLLKALCDIDANTKLQTLTFLLEFKKWRQKVDTDIAVILDVCDSLMNSNELKRVFRSIEILSKEIESHNYSFGSIQVSKLL